MGKFQIARCAVAAVALIAALAPGFLVPSLHAQQSSAGAALSPLDYPLPPGSADNTRSARMPGPEVVVEGPPSPLIGLPPPLPLSLPGWRRLQNNPAGLQRMQSQLPLVEPRPAPAPPPAVPPPAGTWQSAPQPPGNPPLSNPLLLTDGAVIAHVSCTGAWWRLTPDNTGSYLTGSWSQIASLPSGYAPRFFSSAVLPDGRVIIEGGEYNTTGCNAVWTNLGAIYEPLTNNWTSVSPPAGMTNIGDAQSSVLPNGTYMQGDCCQKLAALLDPIALTWSLTGTGKFDSYDEEGWTLLPDGTVLTVDAYVSTGTCGSNTERYQPATGVWTTAGNTVSQLADCSNPGNSKSFEMGPQVLRPDGTVIAFGGILCSDVANASCANGTLSVVTPTGIFDSGTLAWSAGPNIPAIAGRNYSLADAPAALLPSGNVLFAASPNFQGFVTPTHFFEFNGTTNLIARVTDPPDAANRTSFQWNFLVLPTGQILALETDNSFVSIYTPSGGPSASWAPVISTAPTALVGGATYSLSGTQLSGLSEGAAYGDDQQSSTNYPIVQIVNAATGHVFDARSFNHSTRSVAPNTAGSTNFTVPKNIEPGLSNLSVIANGIPSQALSVAGEHGWYAKAADFNGDGKADILWRNTDGTVVIWEMNGGQILAGVGGQTISNGWQIVATGDFDGDGKSDILWRNADGTVVIWEMNGGQVLASGSLGTVSNDSAIVGTGDFNGDGKSDILWRHKDGTVVIWEMNGLQILASGGGLAVSTDWTVAGTGDFNGDGKSDILWRHKDGTVAIWEMNGLQILASGSLGTVSNDWTIGGSGDFNGDGKSDILWRYKDGTVAIWELDGFQVVASGGGEGISFDWAIVGTGDVNADGKSDIIWRQYSTGAVVIWEMNGVFLLSAVGGQLVANQWVVQ